MKYANPWLNRGKGRYDDLCSFAVWQLAKGRHIPDDDEYMTGLRQKLINAVNEVAKDHTVQQCKDFIWGVTQGMRRRNRER